MAKLNFTIPSPLGGVATFEKIQKFLSKENDFKKFDPSVTCQFNADEKNCQIKGSQFTAELKVNEETVEKSSIEISVEVGIALALFKGKIKEILEKTVHKVLKS
jgi:hypothetical protein